MELAIVVFIIATIVLGVLSAVEIIEYRRYRKAAHSVIAFGQSMQVSFDQVADHMNRFATQMMAISQGTLTHEQDIIFLKEIAAIHTEALGLKNLGKTFKIHEEIVKVSEEDGEDSATAV